MFKQKECKSKHEARQYAIEWQAEQNKESLTYLELGYWGDYFHKLGRRFGLVREFKENGII